MIIIEVPLLEEADLKTFQRLEWAKKLDSRSLTQIMEEAVAHYNVYHETGSAAEQLAYLVEMYNLKDHLLLSLDSDDSTKVSLASYAFRILDSPDTNVADYSKRQLECLADAINELEKPATIYGDLREAVKRLEEIDPQKQKVTNAQKSS